MAQAEISPPVDRCRFVMMERPDGVMKPRKMRDCQSVTCKYSIYFKKTPRGLL